MKRFLLTFVLASQIATSFADEPRPGATFQLPLSGERNQATEKISADEQAIRELFAECQQAVYNLELKESLYAPEFIAIDSDGEVDNLEKLKKMAQYLKFLMTFKADKDSILQFLLIMEDKFFDEKDRMSSEEIKIIRDGLNSGDPKLIKEIIDDFALMEKEFKKLRPKFKKTLDSEKIKSFKIYGEQAVMITEYFDFIEREKNMLITYDLVKRNGKWLFLKETEKELPAPEKTEKPAGKTEEKVNLEYSVPCLTVRGDGTHGKLSYLPLKFTRTNEDKPLRIMIADDTPNGSGKTIHSSVWLAAVTAAMLRNDTMHGTTISVEFSGNVDGPSAGGVTCLAILSALDNLPLPNDFAMTGTILPDGTIGVVGGVPEKMRAAAKAGKKRIFIPAFLRFEKNDKGENIDLQRLADELKVKLYRIENISEAYAILHNKKYSVPEYVNVREITRLPQASEDALTEIYRKYLEKVQAEIKADPQAVNDRLVTNYPFSSQQAEMFYQEGKLFPAALQIFRTWQAWQVRKSVERFYADFNQKHGIDWSKIAYLKEYHLRKYLFALREAILQESKRSFQIATDAKKADLKKRFGNRKFNGYFPFRDDQTEFSAQIEPVTLHAEISGYIDQLSANKSKSEEINVADLKKLKDDADFEEFSLRLIYLASYPDAEYDELFTRIAGTLPKLKANKRSAEVERLFHSAFCAANSVAEDNFYSMREQAGSRNARQFRDAVLQNPYIFQLSKMESNAVVIHNMLTPDAEEKPSVPEYHLQASIKTQIAAFTLASAVMIDYGADAANDFFPHLLRNARSAAVRNINECIKANIPCIAAIYDFEMAESSGANNQDKTAVLMSYWRASLYAKALLMSFK